MPDIRTKVAYERAALLIDVECNMHRSDAATTGNETCICCGEPWALDEVEFGCATSRALTKVAKSIRSLKKDA